MDIIQLRIPTDKAPETAAKGTVLLVMGNGADALIWHPKYIKLFVDKGYRVVLYDQRGTGMSDWIDDWNRKNPYTVKYMAEDAVAVLDKLEIQDVHIIGFSMGGMIAQEISINHPERVVSLTLMMTSGDIGDPELPGLKSSYLIGSSIKGIPLLRYRIMGGERNLIKERIAKHIQVIGYDELDIKEIAEVVLYDLRNRRGININGAFQHQAAVTVSGSRYEQLKNLDIPTLIIHGTDDQVIPVEHGKKLSETIPGSQGIWLEDTGHVFPLPNMSDLIIRIISHMESNS
ncbi:alpha/beta hydrolase [Sedimentibacter hydroxybenzoicus DSM 7310]|uniref:Alpha/beta hydrolase n=1 Tax=Sedimentibacter hydroxybenzoicus DSM 7310 TaxID=1123245 RepID=A0A974BMC8_SEDHY|nr:alpha/beta hydrolase [Sedimentibacter hydroxybenzoicus]NYB75230.1 alpha/beta hydrolase [Sedimentibacter hydroxybenzoicus DSM 7310]